jgi:hypothetical protein
VCFGTKKNSRPPSLLSISLLLSRSLYVVSSSFLERSLGTTTYRSPQSIALIEMGSCLSLGRHRRLAQKFEIIRRKC